MLFQNCSGWVIGNPINGEHKKFSFSSFKSQGLKSTNLCLNNVVLEMSSIESDVDLTSGIFNLPTDTVGDAFDVAYLYYDAISKHFFYSGLLYNHPLELKNSGTEIGDFYLPKGKYERITFGFSNCGPSGETSVKITNSFDTYADKPQGFFALNYDHKENNFDVDYAFDNGFPIEFLTDQFIGVNSNEKLYAVLDPYRKFDLLGLSSLTVTSHINHHLRSLIELDNGKFAAGGYAEKDEVGGWLLASYESDGLLKSTDLKYTVNRSPPNSTIYLDGRYADGGIYGMVRDAAGAIYAAGVASLRMDSYMDFDFGVHRYFANSSPLTFGIEEWSVEDQSSNNNHTIDNINDITRDEDETDGSIYIAGSRRNSVLADFDTLALQKLNSSGQVVWKKSYPHLPSRLWDDSFDSISIASNTTNLGAKSVITVSASDYDLRFSRFLASNGNFDNSFGTNGSQFWNFNDIMNVPYATTPIPTDIMIQKNIYCSITNKTEDKILATGRFYYYGNGGKSDAFVIRLNWDGSRDPCFGDNQTGIFRLNLGDDIETAAKGIALNLQGQIIVSGSAGYLHFPTGIMVMALSADGKMIYNGQNKPNIRFFATNTGGRDGAILIRKFDQKIVIGSSVGSSSPGSPEAIHVIVISQ